MIARGTRYDAYTATTRAVRYCDAVDLVRQDSDTLRPGQGRYGYADRVGILDVSGSESACVMWGGRHDTVMIEVKGDRTPDAVERIRAACPHRVTRADSCADLDYPGAFDSAYAVMSEVKAAEGIYAQHLGDWTMPELGRTYMMGAATSAIRCRAYEKGRQPEYRHLHMPDWARIEVQVRPQKAAKDGFSTLHPDQIWGVSKWTRELAYRLLHQHVHPHQAGTVYRLPSNERALRWMCKQYGRTMVSAAVDLGGWDMLGLTLGEMVRQTER